MKLTKEEQIKENLSRLHWVAKTLYQSGNNNQADEIVFAINKILSILNQQ